MMPLLFYINERTIRQGIREFGSVFDGGCYNAARR